MLLGFSIEFSTAAIVDFTELATCAWGDYFPNDFGKAEDRFPRKRKEESPNTIRARCRVTSFFGMEIHAGDAAERRVDGQCHREQTAGVATRGQG